MAGSGIGSVALNVNNLIKEEMFMTTEEKENKAHVIKLFEKTGDWKNLSYVDEFCAPDAIIHRNNVDMTMEQLKQLGADLAAAFPDLHSELTNIIAHGDKVGFSWSARGTHRGVYKGIAPTGKEATYSAIEIDRFVGGKVVEAWMVVTDIL